MNPTSEAQLQDDQYVNDVAAAELLALSRSYLRQLRTRGDGPPFYRLSARAVRYRVSDLREWVAKTAANSTSEYL